MKLNVRNPKNEITATYTNQHFIIANLLSLLFNKTIAKTNHIKRINYSYNYTDKQKIIFTFDNNYKHEFIDVPTSLGLLNDVEIQKLMKGSD